MEGQPNIKYVVLAKYANNTILASYGTQNPNDESYRAEALVILEKLQDISLSSGERQKIRTNNGAWYTVCDSRDIFYLILASSSYPEDHAYKLFEEIYNELQKLDGYDKEDESVVQEHTSHYIPSLIEKYSQLKDLNDLAAARNQIDKTRDVMKDTINKTIENQESLKMLDKKSESLSTAAHGFNTSSRSLADQDRIRQRKLILYGAIGLAIFFVLYMLF